MALAAGQVIKAGVAVGTTTSNVLRVGADSATTGTGRVTNSGVWWEADTDLGLNWQYCYATGAAATCATSSVAPAANTFARLEIRITATGAGTSSATFIINGISYTVSNVTIDTATLVRPDVLCKTGSSTLAASQTCFIDYYQMRGDASAAR